MRFARAMLVLTLSLVAFCLSVDGARGQEVRNSAEKAQDRREIRQDRRAIADDAADLDRLSDLVMELNVLRSTNGGADEIDRVLREIAGELKRDIAESLIQAERAKAETRRSTRELRSDRREIRRDRREARSADMSGNVAGEASARRELRDDRRDRRDDRRDLRDDRRDQERIREMLDQKRAIACELIDLQHRIDSERHDVRPLKARQNALLDEYLKLSQEEIKMGYRELGEDRRELREDRRETREDRRQR